MELKGVEAVEVFMTVGGKIGIRQDSFEFGEPVCVFVTLEQFRLIEKWVLKNEVEIDEAWNFGVEDDSEA